ncbi:MAG: PEP-CTERM sorting domain-containing protein [Planctomycetota bacterium]
MKRTVLALFLSLICAATAYADTMGVISTDRFGYTGTVKRYATLADAQTGTNQVGEDIAIGNRDLSLYIVNDYADFDDDVNVVMGSWWYTTSANGAGWGNTTGNSGRGFVQLYDVDSSTDSGLAFAFQGFNGSHWTEFTMNITGTGADYPNDYARFWIDYQGGGADKVIYHDYALSLTAGGLEGTEVAPGVVLADNHPTSVTGTYSGIFENVSTSYPQNNGFYVFDLALDMENWAFTNSGALVGDAFANSTFIAAPVPEPGMLALLGMGMLGVGAVAVARRRHARG